MSESVNESEEKESGKLTDHQLMIAVRGGDCGRLGLLFDRHYRKLHNYFLKYTGDRITSEDLVQDVFLRILKYRESYADQSGGFGVWLYTIARNVRFDYYRRKGPRMQAIEEAENISAETLSADRVLEINDEIGRLRAALQSLSDDDREVIVMSRFQDLKYQDDDRDNKQCCAGGGERKDAIFKQNRFPLLDSDLPYQIY